MKGAAIAKRIAHYSLWAEMGETISDVTRSGFVITNRNGDVFNVTVTKRKI